MRPDSRFSFFLGYLLGRRRRQRAGIGCLLIGFGLFMGCSASFMLVSAPVSWWRARSLATLPQPTPAALATLSPGAHIIVTAQLSPTMPLDANGLALFYLAYWQNLPGLGLLMGSICGGIGLFFLICGVFLRFV